MLTAFKGLKVGVPIYVLKLKTSKFKLLATRGKHLEPECISRGLYIFNLLFEGNFFIYLSFFLKISYH